MGKRELVALVNELIALCQRHDLLPVSGSDLADELQDIVANEIYISKQELVYFLEWGGL